MLLDQLFSASRTRHVELDPFTYTAIFNTLGASATASVDIAINADSDFVVRYINLTSYSAAGTIVADPDYLLTLFDSGSGRNLQDANVHVRNITGNGQRPFIWPEPRLIKASSSFRVTLQNLTATAARVDVALIGFKVFYFQGYSRENLGI